MAQRHCGREWKQTGIYTGAPLREWGTSEQVGRGAGRRNRSDDSAGGKGRQVRVAGSEIKAGLEHVCTTTTGLNE